MVGSVMEKRNALSGRRAIEAGRRATVRVAEDCARFSLRVGSGDREAVGRALGVALRARIGQVAAAVIDNARTLACTLAEGGLAIVSGGTDYHVVLVDLRPKGVKGKDAERALERAGLTCNKNAIPFDPEKPAVISGVRLGTSAGTTRGFGEAEFRRVGELILRVVDALAAAGPEGDAAIERAVLAGVSDLCLRFPIYRRGRGGSARRLPFDGSRPCS